MDESLRHNHGYIVNLSETRAASSPAVLRGSRRAVRDGSHRFLRVCFRGGVGPSCGSSEPRFSSGLLSARGERLVKVVEQWHGPSLIPETRRDKFGRLCR